MKPSSATSAPRFLPLAAAAADRHGPGPLRHTVETGSTNADLVSSAQRGDSSAVVLVADHQTAGRGRLDRRWEDDAGSALLVSVRVGATRSDAPALVRALGAAARAAADRLCTAAVRFKWPNDLVVLGGPAPGKLGGLLAEFVATPAPCVVIGLGMNVAPIVGVAGATSLAECGGSADRDALLAAILEEFAARRVEPARVLEELRRHSATLGSHVRVDLPGGTELVGVAQELTNDGSLVVEDRSGTRHVVSAGDVEIIHPG